MMAAYTEEDVGNIVLLEHVNVQIPDQALATLFYVLGLGLTRDPYLNVGLNNMWVNAGEQQFHLPTRSPQVIDGHIGLVLPDLDALEIRLAALQDGLKGTHFQWHKNSHSIDATCPWGNQYRCYEPAANFGDMRVGIPYVEFSVPRGSARAIVKFYDALLGAGGALENDGATALGRVKLGRHQSLIFRETERALRPYDGHHIAIYVANFSRPYGYLKERGLISEEIRNHQFRFKDIVDIEGDAPVFALEHEVRSLHHPMFARFFVNRDATQSQRGYRRGRDAEIPYQTGELE
jgi:hypothetical protein